MDNIFHLIAHSNLFNFAIFLLIIIVIAKKVDLPLMLSKMRDSVAQEIEDSTTSRETSVRALKDAQKSLDESGAEIKEIFSTAELHVDNLSKEISDAALRKKNSIELNAQKAVENEEKVASNMMTSAFGVESVLLAEANISNILKTDVELQRKFVEKSLQEFEEAVL